MHNSHKHFDVNSLIINTDNIFADKLKKVTAMLRPFMNGAISAQINQVVASQQQIAGAAVTPYKLNLGIQLPQLKQMAPAIGEQMNFSAIELFQLWSSGFREGAVLALYLFNAESLSLQEAQQLTDSCHTPELAELLSFILLRKCPLKEQVKESIANGQNPFKAQLLQSL